jgi:hypothetical protein
VLLDIHFHTIFVQARSSAHIFWAQVLFIGHISFNSLGAMRLRWVFTCVTNGQLKPKLKLICVGHWPILFNILYEKRCPNEKHHIQSSLFSWVSDAQADAYLSFHEIYDINTCTSFMQMC